MKTLDFVLKRMENIEFTSSVVDSSLPHFYSFNPLPPLTLLLSSPAFSSLSLSLSPSLLPSFPSPSHSHFYAFPPLPPLSLPLSPPACSSLSLSLSPSLLPSFPSPSQ